LSVPTDPEAARADASPAPLILEPPGPDSAHEVPPGPTVHGEAVLRKLEHLFFRLDRLLGRIVPESLNPLLHTGAIAVTSFLVATVTGIILLLWYQPSVYSAFDSVQAMSDSPFTSGLVRSLHRYSSDLAMFICLVHALRLFLGRRFNGAQWLAWVTGVALVGLLWFIGWTGYWLVWDLRAQQLAVGSARLLDVMPIFTDPLGRTFLIDEGVNSFLFFVVFFFHMLVPLAMGMIMWLHITRVARARFITEKPMTWWVMGALLLLSLAYPASNAGRAEMTAIVDGFSMDWWYLAPIALTDRLSVSALWSITLGFGLVGFTVPWWLGRRRPRPAAVVESRCNACTKCYQDCPYVAISMVPRSDGSTKYDLQAQVDPSICVGCGICAGSCDTAGVGLGHFAAIDQRREIERWMQESTASGETVHMAFACAESAADGLTVDPQSGVCEELPGYRVLQVPCAGWVHPLMIERALRHGAEGVMIVGCGPGECHYREGASWEKLRIEGLREPALRQEKVAREQVLLLGLDRTQKKELVSRAIQFGQGSPPPSDSPRLPVLTGLAAALLAAVFAGLVGVASDLGYASPQPSGSELVVSFKHPGRMSENCEEVSEEELADIPVHMRQARKCERARAAVRLRVHVDGQPVVESSSAPSGLWSDGPSVTVERVSVALGEHRVRVEIGDGPDPDEWTFVDERTLEFGPEHRRVVLFERVDGFVWR